MPTMNVKLATVQDGDELECEYETEGDDSGPSYSPMFGADSGDPLIITLLDVHDAKTDTLVILNDREVELVEAYICEHHEFDYADPEP